MIGKCDCRRVDEAGDKAVAHVEIGPSLLAGHVDLRVGIDFFAIEWIEKNISAKEGAAGAVCP